MFPNSYRLSLSLGLEIRIDPSWIAIAVFMVWSLATGYFPAKTEKAADMVGFALGVAAVSGLLASLILHEMAHFMVARRAGVKIKGTALFLFGGVAELEQEPQSARTECLIALAGPVLSLALCALLWIAAETAAAIEFGAATAALLGYLAAVNLLLALFNLLPAFPLDGGRIYRALLWQRSGDLARATRQASRLSSFLAYGSMGAGLWLFFPTGMWTGLWLFLTGFSLLTTSRVVLEQLDVKTALSEKTVAQMMTQTPVTVGPGRSLSGLANQVMLRHCVSFVPVEVDSQLLGYIDSRVLREIDQENWANTTVNDVFVSLRPEDCTTPATSAEQVLDQLMKSKRRKLMVVHRHRLVGVISLSDLMGYLEVLKGINGELSLTGKGGL
jgi:Zn-dependent protease/CBS domain-containing protein